GDLVSVDASGKEKERTPGAIRGFATVPVAADIDGDGRCEIAVNNSRHEIELLVAPRARTSDNVVRRWKHRGFGMILYQGYTLPDMMVAFADVEGDGKLETLYCGETKEGTATLAAARPNGSLVWEHVFDGVVTDGIYGGISRWFTGRFLGRKDKD